MTTPFVPGSVSLRLYPHGDLPVSAIVEELCGAELRSWWSTASTAS